MRFEPRPGRLLSRRKSDAKTAVSDVSAQQPVWSKYSNVLIRRGVIVAADGRETPLDTLARLRDGLGESGIPAEK